MKTSSILAYELSCKRFKDVQMGISWQECHLNYTFAYKQSFYYVNLGTSQRRIFHETTSSLHQDCSYFWTG